MTALTTLPPHQTDAIARLRGAYAVGKRRVLFQLLTGGKTVVIFAEVVRGAQARGKRVLVLAHWQGIVEQINEALAGLGVAHGLIGAGRKPVESRV